ncbi:MAG: TonB family protein [Acidobacteria bacterium]|nr:TonB family protein [Acidobacteriota bacterium]
MKLAGTLDDFSLLDFLQVQAAARKSGCLKLLCGEHSGAIYLRDGRIVHAVHGGLQGEQAFLSLVQGPAGYFEFEQGVAAAEDTIRRSVFDLLVSARSEAAPRSPSLPITPEASSGAQLRALPSEAHAPPRRLKLQRLLFTAVPLLILLLGAFFVGVLPMASGRANGDPREPERPTERTAPVASEPVLDATQLEGPADRMPRLLQGSAPMNPNAELALAPTIVCRLLLDPRGGVQQAAIYRSRLDLRPFEEAALEAVQGFRFEPALKDGRPVAVWINWPVRFREENEP